MSEAAKRAAEKVAGVFHDAEAVVAVIDAEFAPLLAACEAVVHHFEELGMCNCGNKCETAFTDAERALVANVRQALNRVREEGT